MIRVDAVWMAVEPLDMRAGTEAALARVGEIGFDPRVTESLQSEMARRLAKLRR